MSVIVLMGVSGSGKSMIGALLAARIGGIFMDGDDLHPPENVAKMRAGVPLDDRDRAPWLDAVGRWIAAHAQHEDPAIVACSALKRAYRDQLRQVSGAAPMFVLLEADAATLRARVAARHGHFMPASLIDGQCAALEPLAPDEDGLTLDATADPDAIIAQIVAALRRASRDTRSAP